jgi:hypothetical protein
MRGRRGRQTVRIGRPRHRDDAAQARALCVATAYIAAYGAVLGDRVAPDNVITTSANFAYTAEDFSLNVIAADGKRSCGPNPRRGLPPMDTQYVGI